MSKGSMSDGTIRMHPQSAHDSLSIESMRNSLRENLNNTFQVSTAFIFHIMELHAVLAYM